MTARGIRNNNPLNIRYVEGITSTYTGCTGKDDAGFCVFDTPQHGLEAAKRALLIYQDKHGLNTIHGIINRWAPPSENDTVAYINAICQAVGIDADTQIDLHSPSVLAPIMTAMIQHENGVQPYSADLILAAAGGEVSQPAPEAPPTAAPAPQGSPMGALGILQLILSVAPMLKNSPLGAIAGAIPTTGAAGGSPHAADYAPLIQTVIDAFTKAVPGAANPIMAAGMAQADPAVAQTASTAVLTHPDVAAQLEAMGPLFDRLAKADADANAAVIAGRASAMAAQQADKTGSVPVLVKNVSGQSWAILAGLFIALVGSIVAKSLVPDLPDYVPVIIGPLGMAIGAAQKEMGAIISYFFDGTPSTNASRVIEAQVKATKD